MELFILLIATGILYFVFLRGFQWKNLGKGIGIPNVRPTAGRSLATQALEVSGKIILYVTNFCLQMTIFCFKQAFKLLGIKGSK